MTYEQSPMAENLQVVRSSQAGVRVVRVAAYCRVSKNQFSQESSIEIQMESFRRRISEHPGWVLAGIYADRGLTGTTAQGRVAFQRLMADAAAGQVDYILAKSISRFARNTVDALAYTRKLREMGVGVYFEEQSLDTLSAASELFLTIHAAFAQEESHSMSENIKRGMRNRFEMGIPKWSETYGYRRSGADVWVIHPEEAEVVREIYRMYVEGLSISAIGAELERRGIAPPKGSCSESGQPVWWGKSIAGILRNEKYIGDVEMQKSYTADYMTRRRVSNEKAHVPRYYRRGHHRAIIDEEIYLMAQTVMLMRNRHRGGGMQYPFYGYLNCPFCGEHMLRLQLPTRKYEPAWFCREKCRPYAVKEKYLHPAVLAAWAERGRPAPGTAVTYRFLHDQVQAITFARQGEAVDWARLEVTWKDGETTAGAIVYGVPSDRPCTQVEIRGDWVVIDGRPVTRRLQAAACLERVMACVRDTQIQEGGDIPIVIPPRRAGG